MHFEQLDSLVVSYFETIVQPILAVAEPELVEDHLKLLGFIQGLFELEQLKLVILPLMRLEEPVLVIKQMHSKGLITRQPVFQRSLVTQLLAAPVALLKLELTVHS